MKISLSKSLLSLMILTGVPTLVQAQSTAKIPGAIQGQATQTVSDSANRILDTLQQRRAEFRANPAAMRQYIDEELNRLFDRNYAARLVLGVHARGATPEDISMFADALSDNLMQRYGSSLLTFEGKPRIKAKSESPLPGNRGVRVTTELVRQGSDPTPMDYLMHQVNGQWRIFDVIIEGISYVQTFRNQFDTPFRQKGVRQVAQDLRSGAMGVGEPASDKKSNGQ